MKIIKNKRATTIGYEFLVRLVFALILVFTAIAVGRSFFRLSSEGESSYQNLLSEIDQIQDGELKSFPLVMDKETAIFGFVKDSKEIYISSKVSFAYTKQRYFLRPDLCEQQKACLCLCTELGKETKEESAAYTEKKQQKCEQLICNAIESIDFIDPLISEDFGAYESDPAGYSREDLKDRYSLKGGFAYFRTNIDVNIFPRWSARGPLTVYIQRYKDTVGVCFKSPCISEELKKQIDSKTKTI